MQATAILVQGAKTIGVDFARPLDDFMKAFAKVRDQGIGRAKAGGPFGQVATMAGKRRARWRNRLTIASVIVLCATARAAFASDILEQKFDGVVAPRLWAQVVPQLDGVISRILVAPGQRVAKGDILFEMDGEEFAIDVRIAQADLAEARARLNLAEDAAQRQAELVKKNSTPKELARHTELDVEIARANVARNEAALAKAQLALSRTHIAAPLGGTVGRPKVAPGAFVEAQTGTVLAEIAQLDPVLVSFSVPYAERQQAFEKAGTSVVAEVFQRSKLSLELPSGRTYEHAGKAEHSVAVIDQATDMLTLWAVFPNPDNVLIPGLKVRVVFRLTD
jgi:membrane fusion protein, multidrug efflux system